MWDVFKWPRSIERSHPCRKDFVSCTLSFGQRACDVFLMYLNLMLKKMFNKKKNISSVDTAT